MRIKDLSVDVRIDVLSEANVDEAFADTVFLDGLTKIATECIVESVYGYFAATEGKRPPAQPAWLGGAGDKLNELLAQMEGRAHRKKLEPLKLHNPNTLIKYVRHPDTGKAIGCVVGVQDWDGTTRVGWSQLNPVDMFDEQGRPVKFDKQEAVLRAVDRAFNGAGNVKPATVKVENDFGGTCRIDLFQHEIDVMKGRAKKYFWRPVEEVLASCYDCTLD